MYLVAVNLEKPREMAVAQAVVGRPLRLGRKPESLDDEAVDLLRVTWTSPKAGPYRDFALLADTGFDPVQGVSGGRHNVAPVHGA